MEEGANSSLSVARVNKTDSGNYTCSISSTEFATVTVHVLNGGSRACVIYTEVAAHILYVWITYWQQLYTGSAKKMYTHFNERKLYVV